MPVKQLPGFYYDEEKKRYFRIQENYAAGSFKYSRGNVAKENEKKQKYAQVTRKRRKLQQERVTRPEALRQNLTGRLYELVSARNYNQHKSSDHRSASYLAGLEPYTIPPVRESVRYFQVVNSGYAIWASYRNVGSADFRWRILGKERSEGQTFTVFESLPPEISSLKHAELGDASFYIATTRRVAQEPAIISMWRYSAPDMTSLPFYPTLHIQHEHDIVTAAVQPSASANECRLAVGTDNNYLLVDVVTGSLIDRKRPDQSSAIEMDWRDTNVLATTDRNGIIRFYDIRTDQRAGIHEIRHPSILAAMQFSDDPNYLIAAGLASTLSMYDTRMSRLITRKRKGFPTTTTTMPAIRFNGYENKRCPKIGLAKHGGLGLVFAGNHHGSIDAYSMQTGQILRTFDECRTDAAPQIQIYEGEAAPEIWAAAGKRIVKYAWNAI